jgi:hypothetical protein
MYICITLTGYMHADEGGTIYDGTHVGTILLKTGLFVSSFGSLVCIVHIQSVLHLLPGAFDRL